MAQTYHLGFICSDFRITVSEDGSLNIVNVTKADAGSYTCIATNHFGTASSTGNLVVKGKDSPGRRVREYASSFLSIQGRGTVRINTRCGYHGY